MFPKIDRKPHKIFGREVRKDEVIRIRMFEAPVYERVGFESWEFTEPGEFEWRSNDVKYLVTMEGLKKEVAETVFKDKWDDVLERVLNFRKIFLVLPTLEIVTG